MHEQRNPRDDVDEEAEARIKDFASIRFMNILAAPQSTRRHAKEHEKTAGNVAAGGVQSAETSAQTSAQGSLSEDGTKTAAAREKGKPVRKSTSDLIQTMDELWDVQQMLVSVMQEGEALSEQYEALAKQKEALAKPERPE